MMTTTTTFNSSYNSSSSTTRCLHGMAEKIILFIIFSLNCSYDLKIKEIQQQRSAKTIMPLLCVGFDMPSAI